MCQCGNFGGVFLNHEAPQGLKFDAPVVGTEVMGGRMGFAPPAKATRFCLAHCPYCRGVCYYDAGHGGAHVCTSGNHQWS
jgi:hypothetical protein